MSYCPSIMHESGPVVERSDLVCRRDPLSATLAGIVGVNENSLFLFCMRLLSFDERLHRSFSKLKQAR